MSPLFWLSAFRARSQILCKEPAFPFQAFPPLARKGITQRRGARKVQFVFLLCELCAFVSAFRERPA